MKWVLKPLFLIAIVAVAMIGVMVPNSFAEFTGMAEEPITFESKYDWEKDHRYGGMGIFIEGDVKLNVPYSGQQLTINVQKPNDAMRLYDVIQIEPSGHYSFFLSGESGYWPLGETKIELRHNLAHHTGVITIVEQGSKEIDDDIPSKINDEITYEDEITQNQILRSDDSKNYDFNVSTQCPSIESMELVSDPDDVLNQIVVPTKDSTINVNVIHSALQKIPNNFKVLMYYDDGSVEEMMLDNFNFKVNMKNYSGLLFKIQIIADGYNTLERKINCSAMQNNDSMKNLVAESDIRERDFEESQDYCNYLIRGCEIRYDMDYQINAPNDFIKKSWSEENVYSNANQILHRFYTDSTTFTIFYNNGNEESYNERLSYQLGTIVVDKNNLINSESIRQEMNFSGFKRTVNYFDLESTLKTIAGYVTINEKYYYDSKTGVLLKKVIERSLLDVSGQTNTEKMTMEVSQINFPKNNDSGGGCLIATATYGSEMATEVQQLRELRDNQLLQTESGTVFMSTFNDIYYSFSPIIADYERENPLFKETVKLAITPMISTLSLMENAETESEVLGIGISVIALNLGMYLGIPAIAIVGIKKKF